MKRFNTESVVDGIGVGVLCGITGDCCRWYWCWWFCLVVLKSAVDDVGAGVSGSSGNIRILVVSDGGGVRNGISCRGRSVVGEVVGFVLLSVRMLLVVLHLRLLYV